MSDAADISASDVPSLRPPLRLQWEEAQQAWVLLYPEGMIKLNRSAGEIMRLCNGQRSVDQLIAELEVLFQSSGFRNDVLVFMTMARKQRWLAFTQGKAGS
ncbi:MAG: pyrroloquinoline quinone biosynthesis peptide chaperone PqqD [Rubrivivax sp.]|nr:MAG: pyrroloquinoline quinone biosynthesis peptide chaperone PqqD [Rubrivivax sp.]